MREQKKEPYWDFEAFIISGYRYYSADLGRWISRDPIEELNIKKINEGIDGSEIDVRFLYNIKNLYKLLKNDPINKTDLIGLTEGYYTNWTLPLNGYIAVRSGSGPRIGIGEYGFHPSRPRLHKGIDFLGTRGRCVYAAHSGIVMTSNSQSGGYGETIYIANGWCKLNEEVIGATMQTRYAHLSQRLVRKDDRVIVGQLIGYMGRSGNLSRTNYLMEPTHLHFEVRECINSKCNSNSETTETNPSLSFSEINYLPREDEKGNIYFGNEIVIYGNGPSAPFLPN